jgi:hypothetical protein
MAGAGNLNLAQERIVTRFEPLVYRSATWVRSIFGGTWEQQHPEPFGWAHAERLRMLASKNERAPPRGESGATPKKY